VEAPAFDALQRQVRTPLVTRSHPAYDGARRVWNGMIDRRPLLIIQPQNSQEVAAAIAFAREHALQLSIKGGGHGVAGRAVCDDGLVVDLSHMTGVRVDPAARTATVQGGATLRALDSGSQTHGLATTAGIYRETGVAGLALGGGVGLLMRRFGLTCDNLLAAEVVTADCRVLETSEKENPDLFWALRGGGGNFGVVTRMQFQLHPLTDVLGGRLTYDFADALALGRVYQDVMADAPEELQAYLTYSTADGRKTASVMLCHCGPREAGEAVLDRFRSFRRPVVEHVRWMTYLQMQQHWDDSFRQAAFLEVELPGRDLGRCHPHRPRGHREPIDAGLRRRPRTHGRRNFPRRSRRHRLRRSRRRLHVAHHHRRDGSTRDGGPDRMGARDLERISALRPTLGLRQLPGPGR
jgi:FAD/FMN-containing dehydrogenase